MARTPSKPRTSAKPQKHEKAGGEVRREGANRPEPAGEGQRDPDGAIARAGEDLARLVVLQAREPEVAGAIEGQLPAILSAVILSARGIGPSSVADRALLMRLMRHPAASAAERDAGDRGRPAALRGGLVGRLAGKPKLIEGDPQGLGHAGGTVLDADGAKGLPF